MVNSSPFESEQELWDKGSQLHSAWFEFASPELKNQYRESESQRRTLALKMLMEAEVRMHLGDGEFASFGFCTLPSLSNGPVRIPAFIFKSEAVAVDWDKAEVTGLGRRFEDVRVVRLVEGANENDDFAEITSDPAGAKALKPQSRGGRKGYYLQSCEVLKELYAEHPAYRAWSAGRILEAFNERYRLKFTPPGHKAIAPISERTLRDYLAQYRQESAETGSN
ncbi:MAG TPA: hypothetical protein VGF77_02760 [Allosphingosinicella sp.]|jgi:hypothetical protein